MASGWFHAVTDRSLAVVFAAVAAAKFVGRILLGVLDHLGPDGARDIDAQLVGQRERIADHVGQLLADLGQLLRIVGQIAAKPRS